MPQMNGHSVLRSHFIPAAEKFHQQSVIARRVLRQLFPMLIRSNSGNHRPADHRQQAHHELVVGGANDSGVKIPVRIRAVLSRPNAVLHRRTALQDLCQFFLRGPAAGMPFLTTSLRMMCASCIMKNKKYCRLYDDTCIV